MKRTTITAMALVLLCASAGAVFAIDAVAPGSTPLQVVTARKAIMQANNALVADARAKLAAGTIKVIAANGRAIAATAASVSLLLTDAYSSVYPVGASRFFFRGGAVADVRNAAQGLVTAAEDLVKFADADDKANAEAQIAKVQAACGACHGAFRGQQQ